MAPEPRRLRRSNVAGLLVLAGILAVLSWAQRACDARRAGIVALDPDGTWTGDIAFVDAARLDFSLAIPVDAVLVRITLACEHAELELYAQPGAPVEDLALAIAGEPGVHARSEIVLDCLTERIAGATWYLAALWPYATPPSADGKRMDHAHVTLLVKTFATRVDGELRAGEALHSELDGTSGGFRTFRVDVPAGASALRVDLFDVSSNLDLYARRAGTPLAATDDVAFAENGWGHETLVIERDSRPALVPGTWYVDVFDAVGPTRALSFSILVGFDARVPEQLCSLPALPARGDGVLARALAAVVELATNDGIGSGTILTPDGWILTNAHVVDDPRADIVVSLSLDPSLPPAECFRARLVRSDEERDLALVRIVSGLYGQALPPDYALPTLEVGDPTRLHVGDALSIVGYPSTGGTGSRVPITTTRGIVSGFERADFGLVLKTDAEITEGNSGGAALDEHGFLIGVPSSTVENGAAKLGYVHPLTALPSGWLRLMGL